MIPHVDLVIVVGSQNSSNSKRLQELASNLHVPAYLVDEPEQIRADWFKYANSIGITAGASAPESLTNKIVETINAIHRGTIIPMKGIEETINFSLPKSLLEAA
jgi:4-hydroxy-3-methylbut-2-enyl diphosphate reductase